MARGTETCECFLQWTRFLECCDLTQLYGPQNGLPLLRWYGSCGSAAILWDNASLLLPWTLLLLRLVVATVFLPSGWSHLTQPKKRSESIGMPVWFTALLGGVETVSAVALILGLYVQVAAVLLLGVMLGAIYKKVFRWQTGFFGEGAMGWYYDLLLASCCLVLLSTGGGSLTLLR